MLRNTGTNPLKKVSKKPRYKLMTVPSLDVKGSRSANPTKMQISYHTNEANLNSIGHSSAKEDGKGRISEIQARHGDAEARRSTRAQAVTLEYNESRKQRTVNSGTKRGETLEDDNSRNVRASRVDTYVHSDIKTEPVPLMTRAAEAEKRHVGTKTPENKRYEPERVVNFPSGTARTETRQRGFENEQKYGTPAAAPGNRSKAAVVKRSTYEENNDDSLLRNEKTKSRCPRTIHEPHNASDVITPAEKERRRARTVRQNNVPEHRRAVNPESPKRRETFCGGNKTRRRHEDSDNYVDQTKISREETRQNRASSRISVKSANLAETPKSRETFWGGSYAQRREDRSQPLTRMQRKKARKFLKEDIRNGYRHPEGYRNIVETSKMSMHGASLYPLKKRDQWNANPRRTLILAVSGLVLTIAVLIYLIASGSRPQLAEIQQQPLQTITPTAEADTQTFGLPAGVAVSSPTPQPMEAPTPDPAV